VHAEAIKAFEFHDNYFEGNQKNTKNLNRYLIDSNSQYDAILEYMNL